MAPTAPRSVKLNTEFGSLEAFVSSDGCSATFKVIVDDHAVRSSRKHKSEWLAEFDAAISATISWPFKQVSIKETRSMMTMQTLYYIRVERVAPVEPDAPARKRKIIFG